jgi:hypothetical protein
MPQLARSSSSWRVSHNRYIRVQDQSLIDYADYIADAAYQGLAYYTMSSISNDPFKLARMAGYYKGVQSAGAAVSFGMDAVSVRPSLHST